jgi:hypothetical protein
MIKNSENVGRRKFIRIGFLLGTLGCLAGLGGCAALRVASPPPPRIVMGPSDTDLKDPEGMPALAARNEASLKYYREVERVQQVHPERPPQLGIALSGGGMRAAVFSLGVLSGLHDLEVFPQRTDVLSAVSGGGYIASWFYGQQVLNDCSPDELLKPTGAPQEYLKAHGDFVEIKPRQPASYAVIASTLFPMGAVNLFANGLFGWHLNTPTTSPYYVYRFQKTFLNGTKPCRFTGAGEQAAGSVSWGEIRRSIKAANESQDIARHLPTFVLDSTAAFGYTSNEESKHGYNTVYEVTPDRFGSEGMGYYCYPRSDPPPESWDCKAWPAKLGSAEAGSQKLVSRELGTLERIAMTSGAALDSSVVHKRLWRLVISVFNFDLGHFFPNPGAASYQFWHPAIPLFYGFTKQHHLDSGGRRMLLSDGGHSENLGVYALVRRVPGTILVVDATQDSKHSFADYRLLRDMLCSDLHVNLSIPAIDNNATAGMSKTVCERTSPAPSPAETGSAMNGAASIYYGTIGDIPLGHAEASIIQVIYIKLPLRKALEGECAGTHDATLDSACDYMKGNAEFPRNPRFPFDSTFTDQSYDRRQFAAYRDLGQWVVKHSSEELKARLPHN